MKKSRSGSRREFLQTSVATAATFSLLSTSCDAVSRDVSENQPSRQVHTFFAFDDHSIPWQHNLKVTLEQAQKHPGNPVLRKGPKGTVDHGHAILYGTVIHDGKKFRMWYLAMFESELVGGQAPGNWRPMCYAESDDGVAWIKPDLGLVEFNGSKRNNICLIEGKPESLTRVNDFLSVLYEPDDPDPDRRYKVAYIAHVPYEDIRGGMSGIGAKEKTPCVTVCATSADGLRWRVVGDRPADAGGERFEVTSLYRFGDFYYSAGQLLSPWTWLPDGRDSGRVMMVYRSPDFINWSKAKAFGFARPGQLTSVPVKGQQTHMGAGIWNRNNVLVGLYGIWQDGLPASERPPGASHLLGTHVDLGLLISNDGIHYREPVPDFKVIQRGKPGEWDDVALLQGHAFVNRGDQTMIWYSHWDTGGALKSMEIGLATLRRDGFGYLSLKEPDHEGHFITTTITARKKERLLINADGLTDSHPLIVELLDKKDRPLAGYSGEQAAILTAGGTQMEVSWPSEEYLPDSQELAVRVTFSGGGKARVYALYTSPS